MKKTEQGFTLVELIFVAAILAFVIVNILRLFVFTSTLAEMAGNKTRAVAAAQGKIEEMRNHSFSVLATDYAVGGTPGNIFTPAGLNGSGVVYIDSTNVELLIVEVVVCWQDKYGRVIGEDANLNGVLDGGEDANGNGKLDSDIRMVTMMTRR